MNELETDGLFCANSDPTSARRRNREAKAIAIIKAMPRSPVIGAVPIALNLARPDPTYTFWRHPNDTFPTGTVVYFMYSGGRIKIGFSSGLRERHSQMRASGPFPPVVILVVRGSEESEIELHAKFAADRLHGEWFRLSSKLRRFLNYRLCPVGRGSLQNAENEFMAHCVEFLREYRPPAKRRSIQKQCAHSKPMHHPCAACAQERDMATMARIAISSA